MGRNLSKPPLVSIACITYNQADYIRECLDGFLTQKTSFKFEILIHDDASTDGTAQIIKEYESKYPKLIFPIYQTENQFSKGVKRILGTFVFPKCRGKYIALCEGDDYWTDPDKLQSQVNFLEEHPSYSLCFHPVKILFENKEQKDSIWPQFINKTKFTIKDLLAENFIPSNSVVFRRQEYPSFSHSIMPFDWYLHLYNAQFGKIGYIDKVMSVYRRHSTGLWWNSHENKDLLWIDNGLSMVALHVELMKIYGDNIEYRRIISKSIENAFIKLAEIDKKYNKKMVEEALSRFPTEAGDLIVWQDQELHEVQRDKNEQAELLNAEIIELRARVFSLRNDLNDLKNSRLLGKVIILREWVGSSRSKLMRLPSIILHRIRVIVAPFFPRIVRQTLKKIYRRARKILANNNRVKFKATKVFLNMPWKRGLPLVSVIIPYYNKAETVDDTIDSLLSQTFQNFEIIIVDDGSTDHVSKEKLKELKANLPKANFIYQKNQGVATARNKGISEARGKYVICLDSDDALDPTFIEKSTAILESSPDSSLVTSYIDIFGVVLEEFAGKPYDPNELYDNNMVITAAEFRKEAWVISGGYKSGIGYEDWEFWLNISEHGFWGKLIPEAIFKYRTSIQSRYIDDRGEHWDNLKKIRELHPRYKQNIKKLRHKRNHYLKVVDPKTAFVNMADELDFKTEKTLMGEILIVMPWMTFGGAETLVHNYCSEIKGDFNITFMTSLKSKNEWEYKFKEITPNIYHLPNLLDDDESLYIEFVSNYIKTRSIKLLHVVHNGFMFSMFPELKRRFPSLKIAVTVFNDRVEYFKQAVDLRQYIDCFVTDNAMVANHFRRDLIEERHVKLIPNGINCYDKFNVGLFDRSKERDNLGIKESELAVFFVGRLSEEKNPDIFLKAAKKILNSKNKSNVRFFVIGDGPMKQKVENIITRIGSKNIEYLGYQSDIAKYLSASDIFVLPSSIEGFPLSILEAMAMENVVVASKVGAIPEIIETGQNGFVVDVASVDEIAEIISKLNTDKTLMKKIKSSARQTVIKKYSNTILANNYSRLYAKLIDTK